MLFWNEEMNKRVFLFIIIGLVLTAILIAVRLFFVGQFIPEQSNNFSEQKTEKASFGIYEVCSDFEICNVEAGIKKIKAAEANSVIVTVVDEDNLKSVSYYPSQYLPMADYIPNNYLQTIVGLAHQNGIKVYASINMPHNYWLARHPDWISVLSNGEPADKYEADYDNRTIPPSRVIAEEECRELLKNIINEVASYGVDGIDINDNFQFPTQYLEEEDVILYSSFDNFTIEKFENETGVFVPGNSIKEKADYLMKKPDWFSWRADQIDQLFRLLKQDIKDTGRDIPIRPHLLTSEDPYSYYGLDWQGIAKEVDVLYAMIIPDQPKEKYFEIIKQCKDTGAKRIAASTYLLKEIDKSDIEKDAGKISDRISWIAEAGADEIYVYDFRLIEEGNLWPVVKNIFEELKENLK